MSKKSFSGGLNSLIREDPDQPDQESPKPSPRVIIKSSQKGTREGDTRATFVVNEILLEQIKALAYWERVNIRDIINEALRDVVVKYVKEKGSINPIPKR